MVAERSKDLSKANAKLNLMTSATIIVAWASFLEDILNLIIVVLVKLAVVFWARFLDSCVLYKLSISNNVVVFSWILKMLQLMFFLQNIYAKVGWCSKVLRVRRLMEDRRLKKIQSSTYIEVNNRIRASTEAGKMNGSFIANALVYI